MLVTDIYKAMARARHSDAAVQVTLPGVIEPGAELVVKNESDRPIRVVADPHERLKLKTSVVEVKLGVCGSPRAARAVSQSGAGTDGSPELAACGLRWAGMIDSQKLKTQTSYSLKLHDVRKAAAAYELMHSAAAMLQMLPVPVLEALRDYVQEEEVKDRKGPLTLCDRSFVEHLNELIRGGRLKEHRLFHGITGIVPEPDEYEKKSS